MSSVTLFRIPNESRRVLHFNVTEHPTAVWAAQQIVEAFPEDTAPRFLVRDRDGIYGHCFTARVDGMGIEQVPIAPRSPWQNWRTPSPLRTPRCVRVCRREICDIRPISGSTVAFNIIPVTVSPCCKSDFASDEYWRGTDRSLHIRKRTSNRTGSAEAPPKFGSRRRSLPSQNSYRDWRIAGD